MRFLKLALLSISILPMGLHAATGPKKPAPKESSSFWERKTCYTQATLKICTTVGLQVIEDYMGPGTGTSLIGLLRGPGASSAFPILPSAIGILAKGKLGFEPKFFSSPGGCDGDAPDRWTNPNNGHIAFPTLGGYSLVIGGGAVAEDHWPAVNECQTGDAFAWTWKGKLPKDLLFVWRGESEDGTVDFDCWADPKGGEDCLSSGNFGKSASLASLSTVSTVPEPSTIALLLTGMIAVALVVNRQQRIARSQDGDSRDS